MLWIETSEEDRSKIALVHPAASHQFRSRIAQVVELPGVVHPVDLGGVEEALHVFSETKDGWSLFGVITTDPFKNAGAVVQYVRHHVHLRIVPFDKFTVVPNCVADAWCLDVFNLAVL
jgi:hypothetical protein